MSPVEKIITLDKFEQITDYWNPKVVGELNGQYVKLVKLKGDFIWHHHKNEDELFFVIKGQMIMELRNKAVTVNENEFIVIPKGVEHKPVAKEECWILLFEPVSTLNTGNVVNERTVKKLKKLI